MLGILIAIGLLALISGLQARTHLQHARSALVRAQHALSEGDLLAASGAFADANEGFIAASNATHGPVFGAFRALPILGRTPDAIDAIAKAGATLSGAGQRVTDEVASIPGGIGAFAPSGSRVPLTALAKLEGIVGAAATDVDAALHDLTSTSGGLLAPPVADARRQAIFQVADLSERFDHVDELLAQRAWLFGVDAPRRFLFAAQNPAELRGSGGLMGVWSVMTIDDGRIHLAPFKPDTAAPHLPPGTVPPPSKEFGQIYGQFRSPGQWQDDNVSPHLPSVAGALENSWKADGRGNLDGVFMADPFALSALLRATGPVESPALGMTLNAANVVPFITNGAYTAFGSSSERKDALAITADTVLNAFLGGQGSAGTAVTALTSAVGGGHLKFYVDDRKTEDALVGLGAGGALAVPPGDSLSLFQTNAGGNKIDFYTSRSIDYAVSLGADGTASGRAIATFRNDAPLEGEPRIVLGPLPGVSERSESYSLAFMYCAELCEFRDRTYEGNVETLGGATEQGLPFTIDRVRVPSGEQASITYDTSVEGAWGGDAFGGNYRFTMLNQATINPTDVRVQVTVPDGMEVTSTSVPMTVDGSTAIYEGKPRGRMLEIEVRFAPPPLQRAWQTVWHALQTPL